MSEVVSYRTWFASCLEVRVRANLNLPESHERGTMSDDETTEQPGMNKKQLKEALLEILNDIPALAQRGREEETVESGSQTKAGSSSNNPTANRKGKNY